MMRLATDEEYLEIIMHPDYRLIEKLSKDIQLTSDFAFYVIPQRSGGYLPLFTSEEVRAVTVNLSYLLFDKQVFYVPKEDVGKLLTGTVSRPVFKTGARFPQDCLLDGWE